MSEENLLDLLKKFDEETTRIRERIARGSEITKTSPAWVININSLHENLSFDAESLKQYADKRYFHTWTDSEDFPSIWKDFIERSVVKHHTFEADADTWDSEINDLIEYIKSIKNSPTKVYSLDLTAHASIRVKVPVDMDIDDINLEDLDVDWSNDIQCDDYNETGEKDYDEDLT